MLVRRWLLSVLVATLVFLEAVPVHAQGGVPQQPIRFEHLTVEDGLPHATVLSVLQDQQGFMWFATADGLSRYDGITFKNFQHERHNSNSLSNNNTFPLIESRDGLIWIGTDPGGLNVYDPVTGQFTIYRHDDDNPNSLPDDSVWSLLEDSAGNIWVGTRNGLSRLDRESVLFANYMPDAENPRALASGVVYRIYEDRAGTIWVGGNGGLQRYKPETDDFTTFKHDPEDESSLTSNSVWAMLEDYRGNFWVGTRRTGLNLFDRETGQVTERFYHNAHDATTLSDDNVWNLFEDSKGNLWILTEFGGLNRYDSISGNFHAYENNPNDPSTLSHNDVFWMTEDRSGVLWVTSRYGSVNKLYDGLSQFGLYRGIPEDKNTLNSNEIYSILAEEDGTVWIGTIGGGLNRFDRNTGEMIVYMNDPDDPTSLSVDKVYYLLPGEDDTLWVATYGGGLNHLDKRTGKFTVYTNTPETPYGLSIKYPTTLEDAGDGKLWVGTLGFGFLLFNPKTAEIEMLYEPNPDDDTSLIEGTIYDIALDQHGHLWLATARGGLEKFDVNTGVFTHYLNDPDNENSVLSNTVHALYWDDENQIIWAATAGGLSGLNEVTGKWQNFTKGEDGLSSDTLTGVQPADNGTLWVSSTKGINRLTIADGTVASYFIEDGLQGDQFQIASSHLGPDGEIFFGGSNGLTYFYPDEFTKNQYFPPVVFTEFFLNNIPVDAGSEVLPVSIEKTKSITLTHEQNVFSFKFAALNYQLSEKNQFQYKLEGFDDEWSPAGIWNGARYTNLGSGDYVFKVRASNNDDVWNPVEAQIEIHILPAWWETFLFRLLIGLLVLAAIFIFVRSRLETVRRRNHELEERVGERTKELQNAKQELSQTNNSLEMRLKEVNILQAKLKKQAVRDPLTGLYNRRYLGDLLEKEFPRALRQTTSFVFVLLDLDHFKNINDTYGHAGGDKALVALSGLLEKYTRAGDYAFRYGGEEFMVLMSDIDLDDAHYRAEELRRSVEELVIEHEKITISLTTSIGVASYPQHGDDSEALLLAVDDALYQAKHLGRNRVQVYQPEE